MIPQKVLSVRLQSKSHQKSSKCQNLFTSCHLDLFWGTIQKWHPVIYTSNKYSRWSQPSSSTTYLSNLSVISKNTSVLVKHRKNGECCPLSLLIFRSQWLSWIQVLNCVKCKQFTQVHTPCHVSVMVHLFVFDFVFFILWVIVFWLVRSCLLITLIIYLKSHKSLGSLFECVL